MSKTKRNREIREMIRRAVRILNVNDGDIVLIKSGSPLAKNVTKFAEAMYAMKRKNSLAVVVDNFDDLTVLNEEGMNRHGWYRQDN